MPLISLSFLDVYGANTLAYYYLFNLTFCHNLSDDEKRFKIVVKFLSNAISIGIFLSRDIVVLGNMRASKLHYTAILPKNIARVNQPLISLSFLDVSGATTLADYYFFNLTFCHNFSGEENFYLTMT